MNDDTKAVNQPYFSPKIFDTRKLTATRAAAFPMACIQLPPWGPPVSPMVMADVTKLDKNAKLGLAS